MNAVDIATLLAAFGGLITGLASIYKAYSDKKTAIDLGAIQQQEIEDTVRASLWVQVQGTIDRQNRQILELTGQLDKQFAKTTELSDHVDELYGRLREVTTERDGLRKDIGRLALQVEELTNKVRNITEERDLLQVRVSELEREVVLLQEENKKLRKQDGK